MSQAVKNKANRSPEASAFYIAGIILLGIVVISFIVSLHNNYASNKSQLPEEKIML